MSGEVDSYLFHNIFFIFSDVRVWVVMLMYSHSHKAEDMPASFPRRRE